MLPSLLFLVMNRCNAHLPEMGTGLAALGGALGTSGVLGWHMTARKVRVSIILSYDFVCFM